MVSELGAEGPEGTGGVGVKAGAEVDGAGTGGVEEKGA